MINVDFIKQLIVKWEDDTTEFKVSISNDAIGKTICAFANDFNNLDIGFLIIGVCDKSREIKGIRINDWDDIQTKIADICNSIVPPVIPSLTRLEIQKKTILVIKVNRSMTRPHRYKARCFIRLFSTTRAATLNEENQIKELDTSSFYLFDKKPAMEAEFNDLNQRKITEHYQLSRNFSEENNCITCD